MRPLPFALLALTYSAVLTCASPTPDYSPNGLDARQFCSNSWCVSYCCDRAGCNGFLHCDGSQCVNNICQCDCRYN
ncbi:hypothetical protein RSAG8_11513, partial [Rhizoctonia solani AG-8 WAC10335]